MSMTSVPCAGLFLALLAREGGRKHFRAKLGMEGWRRSRIPCFAHSLWLSSQGEGGQQGLVRLPTCPGRSVGCWHELESLPFTQEVS